MFNFTVVISNDDKYLTYFILTIRQIWTFGQLKSLWEDAPLDLSTYLFLELVSKAEDRSINGFSATTESHRPTIHPSLNNDWPLP
jgi:hypothetical protein